MQKDLLRITHLKDGICSTELHNDTEHELDMVSAGILGLMDQDEAFAKAIIQCAGLYIMKRKELGEINKEAMRSADVKLKN